MTATQTYAGRYHAAGISTLPILPDGSKAPPNGFKWAFLQTRLPTEEERARWFSSGNGIAAVGGAVSRHLEDFDFDHLPTFEEWQKLIVEHLGQPFWDRLVIVQTPRPGRAVIIRCPSGVGNSQKLAYGRSPTSGKAGEPEYVCLIETKAEKGYFLLPGSPTRCDRSGRPYELIQGSFDRIPEITAEEREVMLTCARSFDQMPRSVYEPKKRERKLGDFLPGDDYNEHGPDWSEILRAQGYKFAFARGDARYWTRPGKTFGVSASTDHVPGKFYPFSTNCYPFDSNRAYSKFAFFSLTECGGDFSKAARELARQGYGTERPEEHHVEGTPRNSTSGREITESVINEDHSEREAIQAEGCAAEQAFVGVVPDVQEPVSFIDWASDFLSAVDPPIRYLINELLPERAIVLLHGEPRTRKSWTAADMAVSLATGRPAFGLPRFSVSSPVRVLYTSQEDSAFLVRPRFKALLKGRGIDGFPENLAFAVFKGIDLDSPEWRENLIGEIQRQQIQAVIFDPIRRYSIHADEGPSEVRKITGYLRRLVNETGATVVIVHHDVKPPQNGPDNRRRGHRASGGDWFAAAECPISFETAGDACTLAYPESFKLSSDPEPFKFQLETDDPRQATTARLVGETATAAEASTLAIDEAVLAYLSGQPGASTNTITKALRKGAGVVKQSLERLFVAGKVDCVEGARKAKLWTVR